jgi:hypothetical protein
MKGPGSTSTKDTEIWRVPLFRVLIDYEVGCASVSKITWLRIVDLFDQVFNLIRKAQERKYFVLRFRSPSPAKGAK